LLTISFNSVFVSLILVGSPWARVELGGDREVAHLRQSAANVLDPFVDAKHFLHHENGREVVSRRRHRAVSRDFAALHGNLDFSGDQSFARGRDCLGRHRKHRRGESRAKRSDDESSAVDRMRIAEQASQLRIQRVGLHTRFHGFSFS
jgi:hypothetical protein